MKLLLLAVILCSAAWQEPPVFRSTTRLVEISFIALDRQGNPVTDLRAGEITITDKGKTRKPEFFRFEGEPAKPAPVEPLPENLFTNRVEFLPGPPRNITAVVLDGLNTAPADQMMVKAQVMRYLKAVAPDTRVALYLMGPKLSVLHDFSDDPDSLRRRIEKAQIALPIQNLVDMNATIREAEQLLAMYNDDPVMAEMLESMIDTQMAANDQVRARRVAMTLSHLESLGRHLSGIPGRKNVVWIGGGISILSITGGMGFGPQGNIRSFETQISQSSRRLASQGVALYIVDAAGLNVTGISAADTMTTNRTPGRGRFSKQAETETINSDPVGAMNLMAQVTGGRVLRNTNDLAAGIKQVAADIKGSYSLGFYAGEEADGKWRGVKLKTSRDGVRLLLKEGYLDEGGEAKSEAWTPEQWSAAMFNPLGSSAIQLDARVTPLKNTEPGAVEILVQVDPANLYFRKVEKGMLAEFELGVAEKTAAGSGRVSRESGDALVPADKVDSLSPENFRYTKRWKLTPGAVGLRVLFHDKATGRYGTLDLPVARIKGV